MKPLVLICALFLLGSCTHARLTNFPTLSNKGLLPLSTTNAYLGANLFLSKEAEASSYLFRFFEARGAPTAVEIIEDGETPPRMLLFYPTDHEVFAAELRLLEHGRQWVIRGPYEIKREDFRNLNRLNMAMNGEPLFNIYGNPYRFRSQAATPKRLARNIEPEIPVIPTPTPKPKRKPKKKIVKANKAAHKPLVPKVPDLIFTDPKNFKPLNTDQQAIAISKGYAIRASNGDILHNVRFDYETLTTVTAWYTGSTDNENAIAQINQLKVGQLLPLGTQVRIPVSLLKEFKQMPESYLGALGTPSNTSPKKAAEHTEPTHADTSARADQQETSGASHEEKPHLY